MTIERVSRPDPSAPKKLSDADRQSVILKFALIDGLGVLALLGFLLSYFVFDAFPQRFELLAGALVLFALWVVFAMWASGMLTMILSDKKNARR